MSRSDSPNRGGISCMKTTKQSGSPRWTRTGITLGIRELIHLSDFQHTGRFLVGGIKPGNQFEMNVKRAATQSLTQVTLTVSLNCVFSITYLFCTKKTKTIT